MSNNTDLRAVEALLRTEFIAFLHRCVLTLNPGAVFLHNWHLDAIAFHLKRVRVGDETRLIINMPPRYLKSIAVSVALPAFLLGLNPKLRIFAISYSNELATKLAADFRSIVESDWYRRAFPKMRIVRATENEVSTSKRGFRRSTSVFGSLTGLGGDIFIIDDPLKSADAMSDSLRNRVNQWFSNTLRSRLDNKVKGTIIIVQQRVHMEDLTGYLTDKSKEWTVLSLPAIAEDWEEVQVGPRTFHRRKPGEALHPEHEPLSVLENLRTEMGSENFSAQYQQSPVPSGGAMIKRAWLKYYDRAPTFVPGIKILQSWDVAAKVGPQNDYSVCTTWLIVDKKHYYLLDVTRGRYDYPELRDTALALAERFKVTTIVIEDSSTGIALSQELKKLGRYVVRPIPVEKGKVERLYVQQAKFEAGFVHFPRQAPWLSALEVELLAFPQAKHDDIVDSISQALAFDAFGYDTTLSWVG